MRFASGTCLLALTVTLNFIEPINSEPRTLKDLFPRYNGVMPPVEELWFLGQLRNFETYRDRTIKYISALLLRRDHVIFGWTMGGHYISEPRKLFPRLRSAVIVFDMNKEEWVDVSRDLSRELGTNRRFQLLVARDQVAATHVTTSTNPLYKEAHIRACKEANNRADIVEEEQEKLLTEDETTIESSIRVFKEEYSQAYNRAFLLHLHLHGEYNIHGHRGRNT